MDYTTSWAQLDQSNSQHYGRGYPLAIHTSGDALLKAAELHTSTDDLYERGACDIEEMHEAYEVYRIISAYRDRIYRRWMNRTHRPYPDKRDSRVDGGCHRWEGNRGDRIERNRGDAGDSHREQAPWGSTKRSSRSLLFSA